MIKILWVTSQELPILADRLGFPKYNFGGWVLSMLNHLKASSEFKLGIAMVSKHTKKLYVDNVDGFECYVAPEHGKKGISITYRDEILNRFKPDLIHIEGNEFQIHNIFAKTNVKTLLSIQGILSGYNAYQYGCLPIEDMITGAHPSDLLSGWIMYTQKKLLFNKRIALETDTIKSVKYITGRTDWDKGHIFWINPTATYYKCSRILRPIFYKSKWIGSSIDRPTVFIGNGYSPLKGLHFVLEAANKLKLDFPNIKFKIAGNKPISSSSIFSPRHHGYSAYIKRLIKKYDIQGNIEFLGSLSAEKMVSEMSISSVYVLPSLIENSPNTLGEAMIIGMPCVSAYTGGAPDMAIPDKEALFYRANDADMLAWQIRRILLDQKFASILSKNAQIRAHQTHSVEKNVASLIDIYKDILSDSSI